MAFLDDLGVSVLWEKIKNRFAEKEDVPTFSNKDVLDGLSKNTRGELVFNGDKVDTDSIYTAGDNVTIGAGNSISAVDTTYKAGDNVTIGAGNTISAVDTTYKAGRNVSIATDGTINVESVGGPDVSGYATEEWVKEQLTSAIEYKGQVQEVSSLPSDAKSGDLYQVVIGEGEIADGEFVIYNGTGWEDVGGFVDTSGFVKRSDAITADELDAILV